VLSTQSFCLCRLATTQALTKYPHLSVVLLFKERLVSQQEGRILHTLQTLSSYFYITKNLANRIYNLARLDVQVLHQDAGHAAKFNRVHLYKAKTPYHVMEMT
jgi:hypothetical protein